MNTCLDYDTVIQYFQDYEHRISQVLERPMTVIVALAERPDSILIAADGEALESDCIRLHPGNKLRQCPNVPIAWGCSGNSEISRELSQWIEQLCPDAEWSIWQDKVIRRLSELNAHQREMTRLSGADVKDDYLSKCLMAGHLGGVAQILEFDNVGRVSSYTGQGFHAIGGGAASAYIIFLALRHTQGIDAVGKMRIIMRTLADTVPLCGTPLIMWRVEPSGITEVPRNP